MTFLEALRRAWAWYWNAVVTPLTDEERDDFGL